MPFLIALGAVLVLTPVAGWIGRSVRLVDRPGDLKIHDRTIPTLGGASVVAGIALALAVDSAWPEWGVIGAVLLALFVGTVDDVRPLSPWLRAALVGACGGIIVASTSVADLGFAAGVGVVLLVLACANAVNITDGQDGLAGGLSAIGALGMAAVGAIETGAPTLALALGGALMGFLAWNRPPARIFLGNGGAYAVGVMLALLATRLTVALGWRGLMAAGACLALLAFELVFTVARRAVSGGSMAAGDRLHSYDLAASSVGRSRSTLLFLGLAALAVAVAPFITIVPIGVAAGAEILAGGLAAVWGVRLWARRPAAST
jgi:UDP-GlcNAc:undecaprenyl-phosphate/decaprenyl-phosphate GlcNAc-1-phosphate transferase